MKRPSPGFLASLGGLGMTLFAWYGPWLWPAWPAFAFLEIVFHDEPYSALPPLARAATLVFLIVLNVATWAGILLLLSRVSARIRKGKASPVS